MLDWEGQPLLRFLCQRMLDSGLSPVRVVLGAYIAEGKEVLCELPVECFINPNWENGMVSSLQTGIDGLDNTMGVVMTLGDHPYLPFSLIRKLEGKVSGQEDLIIPQYQKKSGHPVLWLPNSFDVIRQLKTTESPRDAQALLKVRFFEWRDANILEDIDTIADYERIKNLRSFQESNNT